MRKISPQYGRILVLCLVLAALASVLHRRGVLDGLELRSYDWRFVQRGAREVRDDIVIVAVDDKSIQDLEAGFVYEKSGEERRWKWPWPLDVHARLIEVLTAAGAHVIAFDVLFSEVDPRFRVGEAEMAAAIRKSGRVFLAAYYSPAVVNAEQAHGEGLATYGARIVPGQGGGVRPRAPPTAGAPGDAAAVAREVHHPGVLDAAGPLAAQGSPRLRQYRHPHDGGWRLPVCRAGALGGG
jgi:hypothetical protein